MRKRIRATTALGAQPQERRALSVFILVYQAQVQYKAGSMFVRTVWIALLLGSMLAVASRAESPLGDHARNPNDTRAAKSPEQSGLVARIHWLGTKRLLSDTNAAYLEGILALPEAARLKAQTLDKLALWLGQATPTNYAAPPTNYTPVVAANATATLLRPLLSDLVEQECYLELNHATAGQLEFGLGVRLDDNRAELWKTNLASALQALAGVRPAPVGSSTWRATLTNATIPKSTGPVSVTFSRTGAWMLVGVEAGSVETQRSIITRLKNRIDSHPAGAPFGRSSTNYWVECELDFGRLAAFCPFISSIGPQPSTNLPWLSLRIFGDGTDVHTTGELVFPQPLPLELEPWNIPTNLIHDPVLSFTAVRAFRPILTNCSVWRSLNLPSSPNQLFVWALKSIPVQDYAAAPWPSVSASVQQLSDRLIQFTNPRLAARRFGRLERTNSDGVIWRGAPFISPELRSITNEPGEFALASLIPLPPTPVPLPEALLDQVLSRTNLLYYDWELTGPRLDQWVYLSQLARLLAGRAQLPPASASFEFLKAAGAKLRNCVSLLTATTPERIQVIRRSSLGLTAVELHLIADWLESPAFPRGLYTTFVPAPSLPGPGAGKQK